MFLKRKITAVFTLILTLMPPMLEAQSLRFGVFPYLSTNKLLQLHYPLVQYLNRNLEEGVGLESAASFAAFIQRTAEADFDLIMTAPHMGRLAEAQSGYQRVASSSNFSHAVFVTHLNNPLKSLRKMSEGRVIMPPKKAIVTQLALDHLREQGVNPASLEIHYAKSHNAAALAAINGDFDLAVFGLPTWGRLSVEQKQQLNKVSQSKDIPGFLLLASPYVKAEKVTKLKRLLLAFNDTEQGQRYFTDTRLKSFRAITDQDMEFLTPYVERIFNIPMR